VDIRNSHKANRHLQVYSSDEGDEESATRTLLGGSGRNGSHDSNNAFESSGQSRDEAAQWQATLRTSLPPVWVDLIDQVEECVSGIQGDMRALSRLHAQRLMVTAFYHSHWTCQLLYCLPARTTTPLVLTLTLTPRLPLPLSRHVLYR